MIRRAVVGDAGRIAQTEALAGHRAWSADQVADQLRSPLTFAWIDEVGAFILTTVVADEAELLLIAVPPEAQRQGRARLLLAFAVQAWREAGIVQGFLEVRHDNTPAIALYRVEGWMESGRRRAYYRDGTDAILMRWAPR